MKVTRIEWLFVATILFWAAVAVLSRILHNRQLGHGRKRYQIAPPPLQTSMAASADRRRALTRHIERFSSEGGIGLEFIEHPPGLENVRAREFPLNDVARYWHASRLNLQLEDDGFRLLERVTDTFVCLQRAGRISADQFPYAIHLQRKSAKTKLIAPWLAVISSDEPDVLFKVLEDLEIRDWLGIGIDFVSRKSKTHRNENGPEATPTPPSAAPSAPRGGAPPAAAAGGGAAVAFGRCTLGNDGLDGRVGGTIGLGGQKIGVTCRHVLSTDCGSIAFPMYPLRPLPADFTQEVPDVAFIKLNNACFSEDTAHVSEDISAMSQDDLDKAVKSRIIVAKSPRTDRRRGVIVTSEMSGFKLGNHFYRGPHFGLTQYFVNVLGITWPLWKRFSKPGDSGSWIVNRETKAWYGMVVGGYEPPVTLSVGISAAYVLDAFSRYQQAQVSAGIPRTLKAFA